MDTAMGPTRLFLAFFVPATPNADATQAEFEHGFCDFLEL